MTVNKRSKITLIKKTKVGEDWTAIFSIENQAYMDKIKDRMEMLLANNSIKRGIEEFKKNHKNRKFLTVFFTKHKISGPDKEIVKSLIAGRDALDKYLVEVTVKNNDDNYFYVKVPNNLNKGDMNDLFGQIKKFINTTKNKTTRISPRINTKIDARIKALHTSGKGPAEIAKILDYDYGFVNSRLKRIKEQSVKYE